MNIHYNQAAELINHMAVIHINTIMYWLVAQMTHKLWIDLQDRNSEVIMFCYNTGRMHISFKRIPLKLY